MKKEVNYAFLAIGKTKESTEGVEIKRYIGVGSSFVLAVNPPKAKLDELMGFESQSDPEYVGSDENGKFARVNFIVRTDPAVTGGIEATNRISFTIRLAPAYNKDRSKVQVIDKYGNSTWANVEDAKEGKKLFSSNGSPLKIDNQYRMANVGEADLVAFLKAYLNVDDAFNYKNGAWELKEDASDCIFGLEHMEDYLNGDFSEIQDAVKLQPNNKVKLLYGVRTTENGNQYQAIATRDGFVLKNGSGNSAITRLEKNLINAKQAGSYATTEFKVQPLAEYTVEPTDLSKQPQAAPVAQGSEDVMPWDQ